MDMTIPLVLFLHIGGNIALFSGLFILVHFNTIAENLMGIRSNRDIKEPSKTEQKQEIKRLERELRRL